MQDSIYSELISVVCTDARVLVHFTDIESIRVDL